MLSLAFRFDSKRAVLDGFLLVALWSATGQAWTTDTWKQVYKSSLETFWKYSHLVCRAEAGYRLSKHTIVKIEDVSPRPFKRERARDQRQVRPREVG